MECFYCGKDVGENEGKIYPLERPYVNLWMHRSCTREVTIEYLEENIDRIYERANTYVSKPKKRNP